MTLIFDIGRTHKKTLLFDGEYQVIYEDTRDFDDITDDDGDPCEDIEALKKWILETVEILSSGAKYNIEAINFSSHGASLVHLDEAGNPVTPLYDYMKSIPDSVSKNFYQLFGGKEQFSYQTGSPTLDMLNSGIQLFWLKNQKLAFFSKIKQSLHLPQYGNYLLSGKYHSDMTSIGCHTGLWDFRRQQYHHWLSDLEVSHLLPKAASPEMYDLVSINGKSIPVGIGLHDSSAALLPFVMTAHEPFVLLSTGTWNITMNPYFSGALSEEDYAKDCLYYLLDINKKVASARLFLGNEFQYQTEKLSEAFNKPKDYFRNLAPEKTLFEKVLLRQSVATTFFPQTMKGTGPLPNLEGRPMDYHLFESFEEAYHKLVLDMAFLQKLSLDLVSERVKRLYLSGGFVHNQLFLEVLQAFLPEWKIFIAENKRASALGAAVALHRALNVDEVPGDIAGINLFKSKIPLDITLYKDFFTHRNNH